YLDRRSVCDAGAARVQRLHQLVYGRADGRAWRTGETAFPDRVRRRAGAARVPRSNSQDDARPEKRLGNHMRRRQPPRMGCWLLGCLLSERDREAVMGDLAEEYALRARSASLWYWGQVYRSVPSILWRSARGGHWLPALSVAMGVYIAAGAAEFAGD